ncbi:hypothetical protein ACFPM0_26110 [Pseudonocardia sulfidoxydans]|uniref:hypothetical protein n=1 Tax=Pseudonocardia sulfidoxydans TaxID=54011 RepID=UPI00361FB808
MRRRGRTPADDARRDLAGFRFRRAVAGWGCWASVGGPRVGSLSARGLRRRRSGCCVRVDRTVRAVTAEPVCRWRGAPSAGLAWVPCRRVGCAGVDQVAACVSTGRSAR